jgi:hypothetical protein
MNHHTNTPDRRGPAPRFSQGYGARAEELAARLTALGLSASLVDRCPVTGCEVCDRPTRRAA